MSEAEGLEPLVDRRAHVDLQQEVHAAAQVEAEVHRQRMQRLQPGGRVRDQVQRDDVGRIVGIRIQRSLDRVLGLQLDVGVAEARAHRRIEPGRCRRTRRRSRAWRPSGWFRSATSARRRP